MTFLRDFGSEMRGDRLRRMRASAFPPLSFSEWRGWLLTELRKPKEYGGGRAARGIFGSRPIFRQRKGRRREYGLTQSVGLTLMEAMEAGRQDFWSYPRMRNRFPSPSIRPQIDQTRRHVSRSSPSRRAVHSRLLILECRHSTLFSPSCGISALKSV